MKLFRRRAAWQRRIHQPASLGRIAFFGLMVGCVLPGAAFFKEGVLSVGAAYLVAVEEVGLVGIVTRDGLTVSAGLALLAVATLAWSVLKAEAWSRLVAELKLLWRERFSTF